MLSPIPTSYECSYPTIFEVILQECESIDLEAKENDYSKEV